MASFGTIISPIPTQAPGAIAANYFVTISELSAHNTASAHDTVIEAPPSTITDTLAPFLPYTPFILFALLFVIVFGIFIINRVRNLKNVMAAFMVAFMLASIPTLLTYIAHGSRQEVKAGPEEVPRNVRVAPASPTSVLISWETDAARLGVVRFGTAPFTLQATRVYIADNQKSVRTHSVEIDKLVKKETYEFEILSGTRWYDNAGSYIRFTVP
jgi:hypothetical protein